MDRSEIEEAETYASGLLNLTNNSKSTIDMLSMAANKNIIYATIIVKTLESHLQKVRAEIKLPVLYLIDSILKNVGDVYTSLFTQNIVSTFCGVFEKADKKTRSKMFKLRQTWNKVFPPEKLYALDVRVNAVDPAWPITAVPHTKNVNPKFFRNSGTVTVTVPEAAGAPAGPAARGSGSASGSSKLKTEMKQTGATGLKTSATSTSTSCRPVPTPAVTAVIPGVRSRYPWIASQQLQSNAVAENNMVQPQEDVKKPLVEAANQNVDLRQHPGTPNRKRLSTGRRQQLSQKKKRLSEKFKELFGSDDDDLEQFLGNVPAVVQPLPPSPSPPPVISQSSPVLTPNDDKENGESELKSQGWAKYKEKKPDIYKSPVRPMGRDKLDLQKSRSSALGSSSQLRGRDMIYGNPTDRRMSHFHRSTGKFGKLGQPLLYHRLSDREVKTEEENAEEKVGDIEDPLKDVKLEPPLDETPIKEKTEEPRKLKKIKNLKLRWSQRKELEGTKMSSPPPAFDPTYVIVKCSDLSLTFLRVKSGLEPHV